MAAKKPTKKRAKRDEKKPSFSYLAPDIDPAAVAAVFRAGVALARSTARVRLPDEQLLVSITIEQLGVREAATLILAKEGEGLEVLVFANLDDLEAYLDAVEAWEPSEQDMPAYVALGFERWDELPAELRTEIATHGWEVPDRDACPWFSALDEGLVVRPMIASELTLVEAIALALPTVMTEQELPATSGRTVSVATHTGELEVVVQASFSEERARPPYDLLADLLELGTDEEEVVAEIREELEGELLEVFAASPEAKGIPEMQFCRPIMDLASSFYGRPLVTLRPSDLRELLFEIIPSKLSVDASAAPSIILELRAFYTFLGREFQHAPARACLRVLGGDAVAQLEAALADPGSFGIAKSLVTAGREAGFDLDSKEGLEAWMRTMENQPLPASVRLPPASGARRVGMTAAGKAKKNQRKAARKARKKSR